MTKHNGIKHYIQDEKIEELQHEYVEVDDKAVGGDLIVVTEKYDGCPGEFFDIGHIGVVMDGSHPHKIHVDFSCFPNSFIDDDGVWTVGDDTQSTYKVIRPTDAIRLNGRRYDVAEVGSTRTQCKRERDDHLLDLVSNLASRVYELEREMATREEDIEELHEIAEDLTDDIILLDNRTFDQLKVGDGYGR